MAVAYGSGGGAMQRRASRLRRWPAPKRCVLCLRGQGEPGAVEDDGNGELQQRRHPMLVSGSGTSGSPHTQVSTEGALGNVCEAARARQTVALR
jgi:hypothetical protein